MTSAVFSPFTLPCGAQLPNRLAKAAMEENMSDEGQVPGPNMLRLYQRWAEGGTGLLITGNVMVDGRAMTGPGGIVLEKNSALAPFEAWAKSAKKNNTQAWMQINHPGRQVYAAMGGDVLSPSTVPLDLGKHSHLFGKPRAMTHKDIEHLIQRFVDTALKAEQAGFDGIQIHGAHGYLISQFLSPLTNKRKDEFGGSIENRMRLLISIIEAVRAQVAPTFAVAVKLNSADFQRGGFDADDAKIVILAMNKLDVDLVELSGGSYESPAMQGTTADGRTLQREAYFLDFAKEIAQIATMPIMTTGGVRRLAVAEDVLANGIDVVGMGTALAMNPSLPNDWKKNNQLSAHDPVVRWKDKTLSSIATMAVIKRQLQRMGEGKQPKLNASPIFSLINDRIRLKKLTKRYQAYLAR
ncbi:MAG: NADH:flavin oxidoreductase/NADH oxidase family protein [Oleispira antarctica]|uniref:Putative NADH:flavin oxidoreductase/NADH oxidase n=1 Tax=Oleispira antarctica RB-8 TaxID=698738 RepID=R4YPR3_OLEAN|nr:NADH:flavin oxidoreductase/NADH oxidase family protein [Oleispira antarctica]MBQ0791714.1 NADH:flavin oxidoreductase/NADH oxidase family protein [Oleispira antarctica]CCK75248.1 putative NADH:flavin oxidoreductase/NADH oxidase [Oleispira antarctica RB-8]|tara:strand:+ start:1196 stop:2425 length:1230 start_codon:yes stop_codon:yes gene_type:complete